MGTYVTIGVTSFIDDFLYQLIGSRPGDTVYVEVTFPEFYPQAPHLENQPALFITEINYIAEEMVPELTDGFVTEFLYGMTGWTTVEEMKEHMISVMRHNAFLHYIHDYFTTQVTVSYVPETILNYQHMVMIDFYRGQAANFGMELLDLLAIFMGMERIEELVEMNYDYSVREAIFNLVVQAVAEDAGLTVTSAELEDYFYEHTGTRDYSMFAESHGLPFLKHVVLTQLVIDYVIENAVLE
jgi:trigger factor